MHRSRGRQDWQDYLAAAMSQRQLLNGSPASRLEVARAAMHTEDSAIALEEVRAFTRMGQTSEFLDTSQELASLRATQEFLVIHGQLEANGRSVETSSTGFRLQDGGLVPEDIDYDPAKERFYISSVLEKKIIMLTRQGVAADFAQAPDGWSILAVKIDNSRRLLWASEVAMQGFANIKPADGGRSAILCYDLRSGELLARIEAPRPGGLGDMALMPDGTVIASDGDSGAIYRVGRDRKLERIDAGDFISPQTPVVLGNGERVIVPDYVRGLGLLELTTRKVTWFSSAGKYALTGIDGLYRYGGRLIAVQNGTSPQRVASFSMDSAATHIIDERILEQGSPALGTPTHGVVVDGHFYFIANSGWNAFDEKGEVKAGMRLTPASVLKVDLPLR